MAKVNLDLAKESSVQQVLSAVGNIDNSISNSSPHGFYTMHSESISGATLNQNMTLVDVEGKGKLFWVYLYSYLRTTTTSGITSSNSYIDYKITIDEEVLFYIRNYSGTNYTTLSANFFFGDVNNLIQTIHGGNTTSTTFYNPSIDTSLSTYNESWYLIQPSAELQKMNAYSSTSTTYAYISQILDYINFEKSIKVEVLLTSNQTMSNNYPSLKYSVGYILD